jgi:hypothetical protein
MAGAKEAAEKDNIIAFFSDRRQKPVRGKVIGIFRVL